MPLSPDRVVRQHIKPSGAYQRSEPDTGGTASIRLDWNESPFGLSPSAQCAYASFTSGNIYPAMDQLPLRTALANYVDVPVERLLVGAGLDDVINTMAMTMIDAGNEVIIHEPTFGVYRSLFELHGARVIDVPLGPAPDFALSVQEITDATTHATKVIMLCNPNNPTGNLFSESDLVRIIESVDCLVAIDEAYAEFSDTDHTCLALKYDNVVTLRTMSKFAGLAGFRVGYGVFPEALMPWLWRASPAFFNVSAIAADVAVASLNDLDHLQANAQRIIDERARLTAGLNRLPGVTAYPSATNFVLVSMPGDDASRFVDALAVHGLLVRGYSDETLRHCIRISIGLPEHHDRLLTILKNEVSKETEGSELSDE